MVYEGSPAPIPLWPALRRAGLGGVATPVATASRPDGRARWWLPANLTAALWSIALGNVVVAGWALGVLSGTRHCAGLLCHLTTLGGQPALLAVLGGCGALVLLGCAPLTGGLTRASQGQLATLALGAALGIAALLGAVFAVLLAVGAVVVVGGLVASLLGNP